MSRFRRASVLALAILASTASSAAASTSRLGEHLGNEVKGLSVALFLAVAGLVALPVLGRRDVNGGLVLAMLVLILGGFVFAQGTVKQVIVELWASLGS